jgi:hypothetical protein
MGRMRMRSWWRPTASVVICAAVAGCGGGQDAADRRSAHLRPQLGQDDRMQRPHRDFTSAELETALRTNPNDEAASASCATATGAPPRLLLRAPADREPGRLRLHPPLARHRSSSTSRMAI